MNPKEFAYLATQRLESLDKELIKRVGERQADQIRHLQSLAQASLLACQMNPVAGAAAAAINASFTGWYINAHVEGTHEDKNRFVDHLSWFIQQVDGVGVELGAEMHLSAGAGKEELAQVLAKMRTGA